MRSCSLSRRDPAASPSSVRCPAAGPKRSPDTGARSPSPEPQPRSHIRIAPACCGIIDRRKLVVRDCGLSSDEHPEEQQRDHAQRDNQEIAPFVGIHAEHERELYDRHRRRHQPRHVELIEVGLEVVRPVDHRVHQEVHRDEGEQDHYEKTARSDLSYGVSRSHSRDWTSSSSPASSLGYRLSVGET
jgi:hypothetical protein